MIILNRNWTLSTGWVKNRSLKATEELQPREDGIGMQRVIEHTGLDKKTIAAALWGIIYLLRTNKITL